MRHFTQAAYPTVALTDRKTMVDGLPKTMREAFDAAHERSESEFAIRFRRDPDHGDPLDVDTCWRLFIVELEMIEDNAAMNIGEPGGEYEHRMMEALLDHCREMHEGARREYITTFLGAAGLTQKVFARILGYTEHTVMAWKKGAFSNKDAEVPDWLVVWCGMWLETPEELRRRITEQATDDRWRPEHNEVSRSWVGRWSELLVSLPTDIQKDIMNHIRMIVD